ncbi:phosphoenolpyruvate--protein phosphotransferase [Algisphaera agarilytica]|uniref:Phosphoenolpyruvate-protein phosphotransferase n=1 Tax=Algisphaera agarilytica TaxID=1385975 RepID=A0A7X0LIH9_9BACT|nr:phosphoenolpyruvate--protein phosphotransferase [Algisphaera agarilytica]MBB6428220.1 phosphotransferase system enzyme I (PtsI) [Algisphaera agarilytica]
MLVKKGIAVSPGVAIYKAVVLDNEDRPVPRRTIPVALIDHHIRRVDSALEESIKQITEVHQQTTETLGEELAKIFSFHLGMLADPALTDQFRAMVRKERVTAEYAVYSVMTTYAQTFLAHENSYFRDRVGDIYDLKRRVLRQLITSGTNDLSKVDAPSIVIAQDLTPSQTAALDKSKIMGLATDVGGRTSHTAILAHALGIPAIVGLEDLTQRVESGDTVIIDGHRGVIIVEPDAGQLLEYKQEVRRIKKLDAELGKLRDLPAVTKDGTEISLLGNIEFPTEVPDALEKGAVGIGLYRTEFLYLSAEHEPTEEQQYDSYVETIRNLGGKPLTIRTLDLGADKIPESAELAAPMLNERNPFLGLRSIRLCLQNLPMFRTQLRAILRASAEGPVKIMFPLISSVMELRQAKMILQDVKEDLDDQDIPFAENIPVGMMIEVPSAALQAKTFSKEVDFFSIGTNDLIQYTVAVDRANERIANLYSAGHPAVIQLLKDVIRAADRSDTDVSLCGEMAGQPEFIMLLLGLGLRSFSMTPPAIPEVKRLIRSVSLDQCRRVARKAVGFDSDREVLNYLRDEVNKVMPKAFDGRSIGF